jgi:Leishmanolysin
MSKKSFADSHASSFDDDRPSWMDSGPSVFGHAGHTSDLIFLDFESFARGGKPGGGGGGGDTGGTTFPNYISGNSDVLNSQEFNIEIVFKGTWTQSYVDQFKQAADYITQYIKGDVQDVLARGILIDDLKITAEMTAIDGVGGILGQAGPTAIRGASSTDAYLPATAIMQFDIADAGKYAADFDAIILHEMLHSVGFGSVWSYFPGLVSGGTFNGLSAVTEYHADYSVTTGGIPVEQDGGSGTAGSHWDEGTFDTELMTGYIDPFPSDMYVADMTIASLGDLGYELSTTLAFASPDWV